MQTTGGQTNRYSEGGTMVEDDYTSPNARMGEAASGALR